MRVDAFARYMDWPFVVESFGRVHYNGINNRLVLSVLNDQIRLTYNR